MGGGEGPAVSAPTRFVVAVVHVGRAARGRNRCIVFTHWEKGFDEIFPGVPTFETSEQLTNVDLGENIFWFLELDLFSRY